MSKEKRQKRIQQKARHIKRQAVRSKNIFKLTLQEPHRKAKISFATCGKSHCIMCGNPRKFFGHVTIQELKQAEYAKSFEGTIDD